MQVCKLKLDEDETKFFQKGLRSPLVSCVCKPNENASQHRVADAPGDVTFSTASIRMTLMLTPGHFFMGPT